MITREKEKSKYKRKKSLRKGFSCPEINKSDLQFASDSATDEDMWRVLDSVGLKGKVKSLPKEALVTGRELFIIILFPFSSNL